MSEMEPDHEAEVDYGMPSAPLRRLQMDEEIVQEIAEEMGRQFELFGEQNHPAVFDDDQLKHWAMAADMWKRINTKRVEDGTLSWDGIALEAVFETLGESDAVARIDECIQAAAVFATWALCERRRLTRPGAV